MTCSDMALTLGRMEARHLDGALRLSRDAGWPHRHDDWALLLGIGGGFVATGPRGEVLGTAMRTGFGAVSMANMIIVDPTLRGRGIGRRLLGAILAPDPKSEWRLIATPEGLPLYQSLGFAETGIVRQYQGIVTRRLDAGTTAARWIDTPGEADIAQMAALDSAASGADRRSFFEAVVPRARIAAVHAQGQLAGFGLLRPFGRGHALAPLIARDARTATQILDLIGGAMAGQFLRVDTIAQGGGDCPLAAGQGLVRFGLELAGSATEMIRAPQGSAIRDHHKDFHRFALAAQALG